MWRFQYVAIAASFFGELLSVKSENFGPHIPSCTDILLELEAGLDADDVAELRKDCLVMGGRKWRTWIEDHRAAVDEFVAASPAQRLQRREWLEPQTRRRLTLAATQQVLQAKALLSVLMSHQVAPREEPRGMIARAGWAYWYAILERPQEWIFSGNNPFCDNA